jgi:excisionase family DNA binding protein
LAYTVKEAAAALGVSTDLVYSAIQRGELRAVKLGNRVLIPADALDELLGRQDA